MDMEKLSQVKGLVREGMHGDFHFYSEKPDGKLRTYWTKLYPGIYVVLADYEDVDQYIAKEELEIEFFGISYCLEGRYEWRERNKRAFYFRDSLMINTVDRDNEGVVFPTKKLRSFTYYIDIKGKDLQRAELLKELNIDTGSIYRQYSPGKVTMIRDHPKVKQIFSRFNTEFFNKGLHQIKVLEILRFLQDEKPKEEQARYITFHQAEKINEIETYMRKHLREKLKIEEL